MSKFTIEFITNTAPMSPVLLTPSSAQASLLGSHRTSGATSDMVEAASQSNPQLSNVSPYTTPTYFSSPEQGSKRTYRGLNLHRNQKIYLTSPYPVAIRKVLDRFKSLMERSPEVQASKQPLPATHSCLNYNKKCW